MKKFLTAILSVFLIATVAMFASACKAPEEDKKPDGDNSPPAVTQDVTISDESLKVNLDGHQLYVTSIGQAADYDTMRNLLTTSMKLTEGTDFTANATLKAADVADGDTVIIVAGASDKGMGAAGINAASEIARANEFAAKNGTINVIVVQLGGSVRRGSTSDAIFAAVCPAAKVNLIITSADSDGKFSNEWSKDKPLYFYSRGSKMVDSFKFILGK